MKINKEVVRRYYLEVVGSGDYTNLYEFVSPEYRDHNLPDAGSGPEIVKAHMSAIRSTFPDFEVTLQNILADGDFVVTQIQGKGTHLGEWMNIKPSKKVVYLKGINIDRIDNGRIIEHWGEANTVGMLIQMGVNPFGNVQS